MKIGDRVLVTYSNGDQLVGVIIGETEKMWTVDFDGDEKTRKVRKSMDITLVPEEVVEDPVVEEPVVEEPVVEEPVPVVRERHTYKPSKKLRRRNALIFVGILVIMAAIATAVVLGVGVL